MLAHFCCFSSILLTRPGRRLRGSAHGADGGKGKYYRSGATLGPFALRMGAPKAQNVMQITYDAALCSYVPDHEMHSFERRRAAMTWSSDRTSVLLYAILATLLVMSWIYVPA